MNNRGVSIRYGDVAPEAKENFVPTASESEFDTLSQLQQYNLNFPNYANPCELYQTALDGTATAFPSAPQNANLGLWSEQLSGDDGVFATPVVLTLTSQGNYSSTGFTLTFDKYNNIYSNHINIHWYRDNIDLGEKDFYPDDAVYACLNKVEHFNKVVITFYSLNMPRNRLKLRVVDYGYVTVFSGTQLRNVKLIQEIDPISTQISINTADFVVDSKGDIEYSFQSKQPLSVYFNGELRATTFVKKATRKSKTIWNIQSEDYIGLLDSIPYYGGIYAMEDNVKAVDILADIFAVAKVPYNIDNVFASETVTGYIPFTTCRNALMQVAFAIQAVVDTSNSEVVKVFALEDDVKQTIPLNRIMQGQNFADEETVTGVEVAVHSYKQIDEIVRVYDATESGTGQNIFVKFSEPLHDLSITEGSEIVSSGTNYAVINANAGCILQGQKYEHTTQTRRKNNPDALASDLEKIVSIENATLVSFNNIDNIIEKCYNCIAKTNSVNLDIVEAKHIEYGQHIKYGQKKYGDFKYGEKKPNIITFDRATTVGEIINAETEYLGVLQGRIIKQSFNLNGNIIVKKSVMR
jgi:hypothetical protein